MIQNLAVLAGSGGLPAEVFKNALHECDNVYVFHPSEEETPANLPENAELYSFSIFQLEPLFEKFQELNVTDAVLIGKFRKERLFDQTNKDARTKEMLKNAADNNDMSLFASFLTLLNSQQIKLHSQLKFLGTLLPEPGQYGSVPTESQEADILFGRSLASNCASLDIGQSVLVSQKTILAIEAIEGTDACIQRAGQLSKGNAGVLCKMPRQNQDDRFDTPAIGMNTLEELAAAGGSGISIAHGKVLVADSMKDISEFCNKNGLFFDIR